MPDNMIAAINSEVPTGRRMKGSETFIAPLHRCAGYLFPGGGWFCERPECWLDDGPWPDAAPGAPPGVLAWPPSPATITLMPSRRRSVPSTTTRSPADNPELMAVILPSTGPVLTWRTDTVLSASMT